MCCMYKNTKIVLFLQLFCYICLRDCEFFHSLTLYDIFHTTIHKIHTMNEINNTFLKFSKRSETLDIDYLVKTFVNVGPLFTILSNKEHEIIYGRRGTGKTHALLNLKSNIADNDEISVYIDLRTIGSNGGIFSDSSISVVERATRLLIDTISFIITNIVDTVNLDEKGKYNLSKVSPIADKIWDSISEIKIESEIEKTENKEENSSDS